MNDEIFDMMIKDLKELKDNNTRLIKTLKDLVNKIDLVVDSDDFQRAFVLMLSRGIEFNGPTWTDELEKAKELLKELSV